MPDYDIAVVGAGPGGYVAAIRAAQLGLKTAIIEKEAVGGLCLNWGCIPSKALLQCAELVNLFQRSGDFGIRHDGIVADLSAAVDRSREIVGRFVGGVETLLQQNGVSLIRGTARLESPGKLSVLPSGETLNAANVIIATGGKARSLPELPVDGIRVITSREALELREPPSSLLIVGGGAVGVEMAYLFRSYGSAVTILEVLPRLLPQEDEDVGRQLERSFRAQGIEVRTGALVEQVKTGESGVSLTVSKGDVREELQADKLLVAVGFSGNTDGLGLEQVGVHTERGFVDIDGYGRSNVDGVWAVGDVTGRLMLAHVASQQGVTAVECIASRKPPSLDYEQMPRAVYCQPQVASLGLTEAQARERGLEVRVGRFPLRANGRAMAVGDSDGFVKLVADAHTGGIVGFHAIGHGVTEMTGEVSLGSILEATVAELGYAVHAHPTLSEAVKEAALAVNGEAVHYYAPARER